ncbi:MAG: FAD-binding oxidoreductase [bacterium]|nr:FAD-binding oxidoreductase [bacterium]
MSKSKDDFDVIIVGGGIIGTATGYYLAKAGQRVLLLEKDYLGAGSTGRCIGGIRAQFSTETAIRVAMESIALFNEMEKEFSFSVEWEASGYLFLAYNQQQKNAFLDVMSLQRKSGLKVTFLNPEQIEKKFPYIAIDDCYGGAWCATDGQADPFFVLKGYLLGIKKLGGTLLTGEEVTAIEHLPNGLFSVRCKSNKMFRSKKILSAAGPDAGDVGKMVGLDLPVEPERHEALITEGVEYIKMPMIVDYRPDGCYFQQRLTGQIIGCYTPEVRIPGKSVNTTFEFLTEMSRRMIRLVPSLENLTVLRQWAGSYTMTPDGNPIVDETSVPGFYVSVAMCGHGFMLGPALGKNMAQFMTTGKWAYDMSEFSFNRNFSSKTEALK